MGDALLLPIGRQAHDAGEHAVVYLVVHAELDVVLNAEVVKQADVLEGARHAELVDLRGVHAVGVYAVDHDSAARRLVDLGEEVKDRGLARAVRADEPGDLGTADGEVKIVDRGQAAEVYAEVADFEDGGLVKVALRDESVRRQRDERAFILCLDVGFRICRGKHRKRISEFQSEIRHVPFLLSCRRGRALKAAPSSGGCSSPA